MICGTWDKVNNGLLLSGRKIARNVMAMATTGEAPAAAPPPPMVATAGTAELATVETPEFVKTIQQAVRISNFISSHVFDL